MDHFYETDLSPDEVVVYLRKSRSDDPALSVEEVLARHESILDHWAQQHLGATVPENNKYREVVSGETIADRPEIQKVLRRMEAPKIRGLLVVDVQRISRGDLEDAGRLIKLLRYSGTLVLTPPKTYNLQDEYDRDFFERELKRGNEFLEYQKKIMGRGRLLSVQQGNFVGNCPPYGYETAIVMDGKKKCPTLSIKEDEAAVVRMIFDCYVNENMSCGAIARHLDERGVRPPRGEHWSAASLRDLLENVHYTGKVKWNHRRAVLRVEDSEIIRSRPKAPYGDYLIYEGRHQAIISDELFAAALAKRGRHSRTKSAHSLVNPLAGLLFCRCGRAMILRKNKKGEAERLVCSNQSHCHSVSCRYKAVMNDLCAALRDDIGEATDSLESNLLSAESKNALLKVWLTRIDYRRESGQPPVLDVFLRFVPPSLG